MATVRTQEELKRALEAQEGKIIVVGELAESMRKKHKVKKASKIGSVALIAGGIIAAPFTGGASLAGTAAGAAAVTGLALTISTAELAILCGCALGAYAIHKNYKATFKPDGSVELDPKG